MGEMAEREDLVAAFADAGKEIWLVGGAPRDRVIGREPGDEDFATEALPDEVETLARGLDRPVNEVGKRFGTIGVLLDGRWSEITTFRGDSYADGTRWPAVTFGRSIAEDLARRDFTVNALAENAVTGERLDPFGGLEDIEAQVIRAVGEPVQRFREDPLRILRGLRFASELAFDIDAKTLAGMRECASLLSTLSQERVTSELGRLLVGEAPGPALEMLRETGALAVVLPELGPMVGCEQNRFHRFDVWGHTVATVDAMAGERDELPVRRWAALLHDVGKPYVRHTKPNGEWGFYSHEVDGAARAATLLERLRVGSRESRRIALIVRRHMDRPNLADRASIRRFIYRAEGAWADLVALKRADNASHTYDDSAYHDELEAACREVEQEDAEALRAQSPLSGDDLIELTGREPGPWIRPVKEKLSNMVLNGVIAPGDRAAAESAARRLLGMRAKRP
jgi:poly(A) polymerase